MLPFLFACAVPGVPTDTATEATPDVPCVERTFYYDQDGDGFGGTPVVACRRPRGAMDTETDCDDADHRRYPSAIEHCDDLDEDCDGETDELAVDAVERFADADGDGYGTSSLGFSCPDGSARVSGDCDDANPAVNPGEAEDWLDGLDTNCDGNKESASVGATVVGGLVALEEVETAPAESPLVRVIQADAYDVGLDVHLATPEPTILYLLSDTTVRWDVTADFPEALVEVVALSGYPKGVTIVAPEGVPTTVTFGVHPRSWLDRDRVKLEALVEREERRSITSFHAVGPAAKVTLTPSDAPPELPRHFPECDGWTSTTYGSTAPDPAALEASCPAILDETGYCVAATATGTIVALGLDSGGTCELGLDPLRGAVLDPGGLAWIGGDVYACDPEWDVLTRIPLDGAPTEVAFVWCDGAMGTTDGLLVLPDRDPTWTGTAITFDSWENAQCGAATHTPVSLGRGPFTASGSTVYSTDGTDTGVRYWDGVDEGATAVVFEEDHVYALGVTEMRVLVAEDDETRVYDLDTGGLLARFESDRFRWMQCVER